MSNVNERTSPGKPKEISRFRKWRDRIESFYTLGELKVRRDIRVIIAAISLFIAIGLIAIFIYTCPWSITPIMWAFACFATGAAIGFLFGVPKVDASNTTPSKPSPALAAASSSLKTNTNIEQISDWLTKIVVGVTLVELNKLPGFIHHMAHVFASDGSSENFGIALIVYFVALGLAAGYLLTRTYLTLVFYRADDPGSSHAVSILHAELTDEEYLALEAKKTWFEDDSFSSQHTTITDPTLKKATDKLSSLPLEEISDVKVLRLWATAMIGKDNYDAAVMALEKAISQSGGQTSEIYYLYSVALYFQNPDHEKESADKEKEIPNAVHNALADAYSRLLTCDDLSVHRSVYTGLIFYALYVPAPGGYAEAIKYGEEYVEKYDRLLPSGRIYFYLAAAYGQKARYNNTIAETDEARINALKYAKLAIGRDAGTYLKMLQELVIPTDADPLDNDLDAFAKDPEFLSALGLPAASAKSNIINPTEKKT